MATTLSDVFAGQQYAYIFRGTAACSATGDRYITPTTDESGTEVSGVTRQNLTSALPATPVAGDALNTGSISWTIPATTAIYGVKVMTASVSGSEVCRAPLTSSVTVAAGGTFTLSAGQLFAAIDGKT